MTHPMTLILIMVIAVVAPALAHGVGRWAPVPLVIFEILLGILIGPDVLGWAHVEPFVDTLADLGLVMLIFLAGYEVELGVMRGGLLRRAGAAWLVAAVCGVGLAFVVAGPDVSTSIVLGIALTSTALGTVMPILRDSGDLRGRFGTVLMAFGAVGEFGPIVALSLFLSGRSVGLSTALLIGFVAVIAAALWWASRPRRPWFSTVIANTLHSSGQFAVRFVMLLVAVMLGLAHSFGLDILLGAFAAGLVTRLVLEGAAPDSSALVLSKIEGLGFGFLIPLFYVVTGIEFDLAALASGGETLLLLPIFLVLFLLVRGVPAYLFAPADFTPTDRAALGLFSATCLPLVVAITAIGLSEDLVGSGEAAALVGAAMISVLAFPMVAQHLRARPRTTATAG